MKAMLLGFLAMALIGVGAWYGLNALELTSAQVHSDSNVRLD
ncbi:hypothetical protein [Sagittula sp. S175]